MITSCGGRTPLNSVGTENQAEVSGDWTSVGHVMIYALLLDLLLAIGLTPHHLNCHRLSGSELGVWVSDVLAEADTQLLYQVTGSYIDYSLFFRLEFSFDQPPCLHLFTRVSMGCNSYPQVPLPHSMHCPLHRITCVSLACLGSRCSSSEIYACTPAVFQVLEQTFRRNLFRTFCYKSQVILIRQYSLNRQAPF